MLANRGGDMIAGVQESKDEEPLYESEDYASRFEEIAIEGSR